MARAFRESPNYEGSHPHIEDPQDDGNQAPRRQRINHRLDNPPERIDNLPINRKSPGSGQSRGMPSFVIASALNLIGNKWGNANDVDVIYVSGGGAEMVISDVQAVYSHAQLVANARGYLHYAEFSR